MKYLQKIVNLFWYYPFSMVFISLNLIGLVYNAVALYTNHMTPGPALVSTICFVYSFFGLTSYIRKQEKKRLSE